MRSVLQTFIRFSTANSFKSRSKITEFYKATHPDLLNNAPDNVKQENQRSLQLLNSYLDSLCQNTRAEHSSLTFYVPNKLNGKARKFVPIQINLDTYVPSSEQYQKNKIDALTNQLLTQVRQIQEHIDTSHLKNKPTSQYSQWVNTRQVKSEFYDTTSFINKKVKLQEDLFAPDMFEVSQKLRNQELQSQLEKDMRLANTPFTKPKLWSQVVLNDSQYFHNLFEMFQQLIDPRMIYLDHTLTKQEIEIFRSNLVPKKVNIDALAKLKEVFSDMESADPEINLYVTKHYSGDQIPGYFSIPFNFKVEELTKAYFSLRHQIIINRKEYNRELRRLEDTIRNIRSKYDVNLENQIPLQNTDSIKKVQLMALKFMHELGSDNTFRYKTVVLDQEGIKMA